MKKRWIRDLWKNEDNEFQIKIHFYIGAAWRKNKTTIWRYRGNQNINV